MRKQVQPTNSSNDVKDKVMNSKIIHPGSIESKISFSANNNFDVEQHINYIYQAYLQSDSCKLQSKLLMLRSEILRTGSAQLRSVILKLLMIFNAIQSEKLDWRMLTQMFDFIKDLIFLNLDRPNLFKVEELKEQLIIIGKIRKICQDQLGNKGQKEYAKLFLICQSYSSLFVFECLFRNANNNFLVKKLSGIFRGEVEGSFDLLKQNFSLLNQEKNELSSSYVVSLAAFNTLTLTLNLDDEQVKQLFPKLVQAILVESEAISKSDDGWLPLYILFGCLQNLARKYNSIRSYAMKFLEQQLFSAENRKFKFNLGKNRFKLQVHFCINLRIVECLTQLSTFLDFKERDNAQAILKKYFNSKEFNASCVNGHLAWYLEKDAKELITYTLQPLVIEQLWAKRINDFLNQIKSKDYGLLEKIQRNIYALIQEQDSLTELRDSKINEFDFTMDKIASDSKKIFFIIPDYIRKEITVFLKGQLSEFDAVMEEEYLEGFRKFVIDDCIRGIKAQVMDYRSREHKTLSTASSTRKFQFTTEVKTVTPILSNIKTTIIEPKALLEKCLQSNGGDINLSADESIALINYLTSEADFEKLKNKSAIIAIGTTGSGKSTFINFLNGYKLVRRVVKGRKMEGYEIDPTLDLKDHEVAKTLYGTRSETSRPQIIPLKVEIKSDSKSNLVLCDCPGFFDTRGGAIDFANLINIRTLLHKPDRLRFVWLINHHSLKSDRATSIKESLINIIMPLFNGLENFTKYNDSIVIGINHCQTDDEFNSAVDLVLEVANSQHWDIDKNKILRVDLNTDSTDILGQILQRPEINTSGIDLFAKYGGELTGNQKAFLTKLIEGLSIHNISTHLECGQFEFLLNRVSKLNSLNVMKFDVIEKKLTEISNQIVNKIEEWGKDAESNASSAGNEHLNLIPKMKLIKGAIVLEACFPDNRISQLFKKYEGEVIKREDKVRKDEDKEYAARYSQLTDHLVHDLDMYIARFTNQFLKNDILGVNKDNYLHQLRLFKFSAAEQLVSFNKEVHDLLRFREIAFYSKGNHILETLLEIMASNSITLLINSYKKAKVTAIKDKKDQIIEYLEHSTPSLLEKHSKDLCAGVFKIDAKDEKCAWMIGSGLDQYRSTVQALINDSLEFDKQANDTQTKVIYEELDLFFRALVTKAKKYRTGYLNEQILKILKQVDAIDSDAQWLDLYKEISKNEFLIYGLMSELERLDTDLKYSSTCLKKFNKYLSVIPLSLIQRLLVNINFDKYKSIQEIILKLNKCLSAFKKITLLPSSLEYKSDNNSKAMLLTDEIANALMQIESTMEDKRQQQAIEFKESLANHLDRLEDSIQSLINKNLYPEIFLEAKSFVEMIQLFNKNSDIKAIKEYNIGNNSFEEWMKIYENNLHFSRLHDYHHLQREVTYRKCLFFATINSIANQISLVIPNFHLKLSLITINLDLLKKMVPKYINTLFEINGWASEHSPDLLRILKKKEEFLYANVRRETTVYLEKALNEYLCATHLINSSKEWQTWYAEKFAIKGGLPFRLFYQLKICDSENYVYKSIFKLFLMRFSANVLAAIESSVGHQGTPNELACSLGVLKNLKSLKNSLNNAETRHDFKDEKVSVFIPYGIFVDDLQLDRTINQIEPRINQKKSELIAFYKKELKDTIDDVKNEIQSAINADMNFCSLILETNSFSDFHSIVTITKRKSYQLYQSAIQRFGNWRNVFSADQNYDDLRMQHDFNCEQTYMDCLLSATLHSAYNQMYHEILAWDQKKSLQPIRLEPIRNLLLEDKKLDRIRSWARDLSEPFSVTITEKVNQLLSLNDALCAEYLYKKIAAVLELGKNEASTAMLWLNWYNKLLNGNELIFFKLLNQLFTLDRGKNFIEKCMELCKLQFVRIPTTIVTNELSTIETREDFSANEIVNSLKNLFSAMKPYLRPLESKAEQNSYGDFSNQLEQLNLEKTISTISNLVESTLNKQANNFRETLKVLFIQMENSIQQSVSQDFKLFHDTEIKYFEDLVIKFAHEPSIRKYNAEWEKFKSIKNKKYREHLDFKSIEVTQLYNQKVMVQGYLLVVFSKLIDQKLKSIVSDSMESLRQLPAYTILNIKPLFLDDYLNRIIKIYEWAVSNKIENLILNYRTFENNLLNNVEKYFNENISNAIKVKIEDVLAKRTFQENELPAWLDQLKALDIKEYRSKVNNLQIALTSYRDSIKIRELFDAGNFDSLLDEYKSLEIIEKKLSTHLKIDIKVIFDKVCDVMAPLRQASIRKIEELIDFKTVVVGKKEPVDTKNITTYLIARQKLQPMFREFKYENEINFSFEETSMLKLYQAFDKLRDKINSSTGTLRVESKEVDSSSSLESTSTLIENFASLIIKSEKIATAVRRLNELRSHINANLNNMHSESVSAIGEMLISYVSISDMNAEALNVVNNYPAFKLYYIQSFNRKAGGVTFDIALKRLIEDPQSTPIDDKGIANLTKTHSAFKDAYKDYVTKIISVFNQGRPGQAESKQNDKYSIYNEIIKNANKLAEDLKKDALNLYQHADKAGALIACLFALWTYQSAKDFGIKESKENQMELSLLQPHATQLLSIYRLLGLDNPRGMEHHMAQIRTGEGKSIALAIVALFMALLKYEVNVVSHSNYLSMRDFSAFKFLFHAFPNQISIHYQTIWDLAFSELQKSIQVPDMCDLLEKSLMGLPVPRFEALLIKPNRILLFDEVDVFFGADFYGCLNWPRLLLKKTSFKNLLWALWTKKDDYYTKDKIKLADELKDSKEVKEVLSEIPGLQTLIKPMLVKMIVDLRSFPGEEIKHVCELVEENRDGIKIIKIGYRNASTDIIYTHWSVGYKTSFAAFYYGLKKQKNGEIKDHFQIYDNSHTGFTFHAGPILYSELPKGFTRILGLSATFDDLCSGENEILEQQYEIRRKSFITSTFDKRPDARVVKNTLCCPDQETHFKKIIEEIEEVHRGGRIRPILIIFESLQKIKSFLNPNLNPEVKKMGNRTILQEKDEHHEKDSHIAEAMQKGAITLMVKAYGRGIDFICSDRNVNDAGGVHLILTYYPETLTEEKQCEGRIARQDYKGSLRKILNSESYTEMARQANKDVKQLERAIRAGGDEIDQFLADCRSILKKKNHEALIEKRNKTYEKHQQTLKLAEMMASSIGIFSQMTPEAEEARRILMEINQGDFLEVDAKELIPKPG